MRRIAASIGLLLTIECGSSMAVEPYRLAPARVETRTGLSAGSFYEQGMRLYRAGRFTNALPHFEDAIKLDRSRPEFYYWQAKCYRQLGESVLAACSYRYLTEHFSGFPEVELAQAELIQLGSSADMTTPSIVTKQTSTNAPSERATVDPFASLKFQYHLIELLNRSCYSEFDVQVQRALKTDGNDPKLCFLAGQAWMDRCRPDLAEPFLLKARKQGYNGWPGYESTDTLINHTNNYQRFRPPFYKDFSDQGRLRIRLYARDDDWVHSVLPNFQKIVDRAHALFGANLGPVIIHVFQQVQPYLNLMDTFSVGPTVASHRDGCAFGTNALVCELDPVSFTDYTKIDPCWPTRAVMHEYCHCLIESIIAGEIVIPEWLHEGSAEYACRPFDPDGAERQIKLLAARGKECAPPVWKDMTNVQGGADVRYTISMLMMEELCRQGGPSTIGRIFARIRELNSAFNQQRTVVTDRDEKQAVLVEDAVKDVTGIRPEDAFHRVLDRYWGKNLSSSQ